MARSVYVNHLRSADKPDSVVDSHSSGRIVTNTLMRPTRFRREPRLEPESSGTLFGLASGGVYPATSVTRSAVRSYRTFSPLPRTRRYIFCGTFRRLSPPRRYLAPCSAKSGLSSTSWCWQRLSGQPRFIL